MDNIHFLLAAILFLLLRWGCAYSPADKIFIRCGSSDNSPTPGRLWTGDNDPMFSPLDDQKSLTSKAKVPASIVPQVPYTTARLSCSEFSYSILVTTGPKFVRLHFFPYDYNQNFSRSDAFFSVTSGPFTLLRNFSVSLVADYLDSPLFSKQFCLVVEDGQRLNLTFIPSTDRPNACALVNGIEIVSMPPGLYYSNLTKDGSRQLNSVVDNNGNLWMLSYTSTIFHSIRIIR